MKRRAGRFGRRDVRGVGEAGGLVVQRYWDELTNSRHFENERTRVMFDCRKDPSVLVGETEHLLPFLGLCTPQDETSDIVLFDRGDFSLADVYPIVVRYRDPALRPDVGEPCVVGYGCRVMFRLLLDIPAQSPQRCRKGNSDIAVEVKAMVSYQTSVRDGGCVLHALEFQRLVHETGFNVEVFNDIVNGLPSIPSASNCPRRHT